MPDTDYVVRSWQRTNDGNARVTVVDMHGRICHCTVTAHQAAHGALDMIIRRRVAALPPFTVYRNR
jgi:hypothetical protein